MKYILIFLLFLYSCKGKSNDKTAKEMQQLSNYTDSILNEIRKDSIAAAQRGDLIVWQAKMRQILRPYNSKRETERIIDSITLETYGGHIPEWYERFKKVKDSLNYTQ